MHLRLIGFLLFLTTGVLMGCGSVDVEPEVDPAADANASMAPPYSITGKVFEAGTLEPLAGAVIVVNDKTGVEVLSFERVVSGDDGSFVIENMQGGPYRLRVFNGFETVDGLAMQTMLSNWFYPDEAGELVHVYFSRKIAHSRMLARRKWQEELAKNKGKLITPGPWFKVKEKDPIRWGIYMNDAYFTGY